MVAQKAELRGNGIRDSDGVSARNGEVMEWPTKS
jgi:hypothetical protein